MRYMEDFSVSSILQLLSFSWFSVYEGISIIFCQWVIHDSHVRQQYHQSVADAIDDILGQIDSSKITLEMGAWKAHQMRNRFFHSMRHSTSPIGLLVAHSIHPTTRSYEYYLQKNSLSTFRKPFEDLNLDQAKEVVMGILNSARRPSSTVTRVSKRASFYCKGFMVAITAKLVFFSSTSKSKMIDIARLIALGLSIAMVGKLGIFTTNIYMSWRSTEHNKSANNELLQLK
ncbi:hypothetical protein V8C42DRAFT_336330 [Trichoderma barbatum]